MANAVENPRTQRKHTQTFNLGQNSWKYPLSEYFQHSSESKQQVDYQRYMEWLEEKLRHCVSSLLGKTNKKMSKGI